MFFFSILQRGKALGQNKRHIPGADNEDEELKLEGRIFYNFLKHMECWPGRLEETDISSNDSSWDSDSSMS